MKISIIVPVYNIKSYIARCVESIIGQNYKNVEIILVDDGSTDGSQEVCDYYAAKDNRIKVIHKENGGLVSARQAGAAIATGEYVTNIDGDDWIEKECILEYQKAIEKTDADIVWNISLYRDYGNESLLQEYKLAKGQILDDHNVQKELLQIAKGKYGYSDDLSYYVWNKCIKKELYVSVTNSINAKIRLAEDVACVFRCLSMTNKVYFINKPTNHYVQRETSISHDCYISDIEAISLMRDETINFIKDKKFYIDAMVMAVNQVYLNCMMIKGFGYLQKQGIDYLVPFKDVKKGNKVIVYGMGNVGKKVVDYIKKYKEYELVGITDNRFVKYKDMKYIAPSDLGKMDFDNIIISVTKKTFVTEIIENIISKGIDEKKIASIYRFY